MKQKTAIIIPFVLLNAYVKESVSGCLALKENNFRIILLPDNKIKIPQEWKKEKRIQTVVTGDATIAKKRNLGLATAKDVDFYAFIDSDAYPEKEWLTNAIQEFSNDTGIWAVGGPNICPPQEKIKEKAVGNALQSFLVSGTRAFRKKRASSRYCIDLPTCNLIVKKEAMAALQGFNENLITGEDIEFCNRLIEKGKKIWYSKDVVVFHHNRPLFKPFLLQRTTYGVSVFKVFKENASPTNLFLFLPLVFLLYLVIIGILAFILPSARIVLASVLITFILISGLETMRYAQSLKEIPYTFLALTLGNVTPGIGSFCSLVHYNIDIKKVYKNYHKEDK